MHAGYQTWTNLAIFDSCLGQFNCFVNFGRNAKVFEESLDMEGNEYKSDHHSLSLPRVTTATSILDGKSKTVPTLS